MSKEMRRLIDTFNKFVIKEKSNNIKKIVPKYIEDAPWGIIFDGENKILVGDMHQIPVELSKELEDKVVNIANKYGYYGEGIGLEYNEAITKSSFYKRLEPKKYRGSWDRKLIESGKIPEDKKYFLLYALFSNYKENHRLEKLLENTEEDDTIFDVLLKTIPDWSADMGLLSLGQKELNKFLKEISENGIDFIQMSQQKADEKSLSEFLDLGEKLQWPENWQDYPNMAGKFARVVTTIRDQFLINAGPGVYFVGAGHLKDIVKMSMEKEKKLSLIGGEKIM
jgi:hypothetical protein